MGHTTDRHETSEGHSLDDVITVLSPDGTFRPAPDFPLDLLDEQMKDLFRLMVVTRRLDQEAITLQRQGQLGVYAPCLGQEAAQIGSAYALEDTDWMFPTYRELGAAIVRGIDPAEYLRFARGTWLTGHDPERHRFGPIAIPIGTQALHAVGLAMGARLGGSPVATIAYLGDGATSEGDVHEAMNFAAVFDAPCVFFVQNNQYAISVPVWKQTHAPTLAHKAVGYGMPGFRCDGNDVLATYAVTKRLADNVRQGHGPVLVEAVTYRMGAHTTSDDPSRYRSENEVNEAARNDPIVRMKRLLVARGLFDPDLEKRVEEEARSEAARMRDEIYEAPHGDPMELFEHVYVDPTGHFDQQREALRAELDARGMS